MYKVKPKKSVAKDLDKIDKKDRERLVKEIENLPETIMKPSSNIRKLKDSQDRWRLRVGDYRIVYKINKVEQLIDVLYVRKREDAY